MGLLLFFLFMVLLLSGVPIAVAIGLSSVVVIWLADLGIAVVSPNFYSGIAKFQLLAIPLFIFAGFLFERCGISERLVRFANLLVGRKKGSLAIVAVLVCVFFGGISGSGPADAAAIGAILIPAMIRDGYDRGFVAALIAGAGSTAIIVPVSIALIIYGALTNTSITTLFAAGAIPGALAGLCLILPAWWISKKRGYGSRTAMASDMGLFQAFREAFWGLMAPGIILGGLYGGVFTPTEAAVVAVFYGLILGFFLYRTLTLKALYEILVEASNASAVVMLIITFAGLFSWTASTLGAMDAISASLLAISDNPYVVLLVINLILFCAGMLIDAISIFYIFIPIFLPIMAQFGWDPIWFGIMMTFNLAIGQFTPPVAVNLYVTTHLAEIPVEETFKAVIPFILAMLAGLVILALFPSITLFLPRLFGMI
ncbi:TRAP transporter large permease [Desulfoluna butyratoxydans]|uniref:Trap c4-dicarboxylate transport system permease dctm subunit n=1 Tax=Desulfoluna butyratoxydans TaxID=231438 RepID=A0A4U8YM95_9BACT|nr:TRAP transporter large permease [Desulfoluna butyratoxydans]VFQ45156.1 trap c4-dicarboxylate transport system permease dctm subunit [Desulfoluna butyratoxydans]